MKTFNEFQEGLVEAKSPSKDIAFVYKKSGSPKSNFSTKYVKGDYLRYSHMGTDQALLVSSPMFELYKKDSKGIFSPTGTVFAIPLKDVKDSGKKFVRADKVMNDFTVE